MTQKVKITFISKNPMSSTTSETNKIALLTSAQSCHRFSLAEIQSATSNFDDELIIGRGGFGKVYKGPICIESTSHVVAIKRLDPMSNQGAPEFLTEIEMLSKLRHCHLVSLIGYCDENKEMILVYEYMHHGTLYDHLHKVSIPLNWMQRLKISIGAARGLDYLHTGVGTKHGVTHRDVKSSNILLDENWEPRISDFGLSKIGPTNQSFSYVDVSVKGTFGYLDPEYFFTGKLTRKTDVYAFGVVLFELLSGRLAVDERNSEEQYSLVRWAKKCVRERKLDQMVDPKIRGSISPKSLRRFTQTADRCLLNVPKERPTMTEVVASLQALLELQKKSGNSGDSSGTMGFTWKIHKYLVPTTKANSDQSSTSSLKCLEGLVTRDVKKFTYSELKLATKNFGNDTSLGENYGKVYRGWVDKTTYSPRDDDTGLLIAVEVLHRDRIFDHGMLKEISHPNLVKHIGYCLEPKQLFLLYEFMHNGSFHDLLFSGAIARFPLYTKVKIAVGIARGIDILHNSKQKISASSDWRAKGRHSHWDGNFLISRLVRHKILLDKDFTPKLSDYDINNWVYYYREATIGDNGLVYGDYFYDVYKSNLSEPFEVQSDISGFIMVFAEVLIGREISNLEEFQTLEDSLLQHENMLLRDIAKLCFKICNEIDSESKMLNILKKYEKHISIREKESNH